jgi:hypothetical protein
MRLSMVSLGWLLQSRQATITVLRRFSDYSLTRPLPNMACPAVFVETMALKTYLSLRTWKRCVEWNVAHIFGEGTHSVDLAMLCDLTMQNRSVHNIRIERLWVDVTAGFGRKWKVFFRDLEMWDGLNVENDSHIWLLHHLFLPAINADIQDWQGAWNNHRISTPGVRSQSPREMFFFGMLERGPRGLAAVEEEWHGEEDLAGYGVDWEALDDEHIHAHHDATNTGNTDLDNDIDDDLVHNPFLNHAPEHLSNVEVPEIRCPLTDKQMQFLDHHPEIQRLPRSRCLGSYRLHWITALRICRSMYAI